MSEELEYEKRETFILLNEGVALAEMNGELNEKTLSKKSKIALSSAAKVVAALRIAGVLGKESKRGYEFICSKTFKPTETKLIVEKIKDGEGYGRDFLYQLLLPCVKTAVEWGNIGVAMLERKLGLGYYRAADLFGLLDAAGIIGEACYINPGRRNLAITSAQFDELIKIIGEK